MYQTCQNDSFKYPCWYYCWKFWIFCLGIGVKKSISFWFSDVKSTWKLIHDNKFVKKCLMEAVLAFFRIVPFLGPYSPWNYFCHAPLNLARKDTLFKYPYDYILDHNFFDQIVAKFKLINFATIILITYFCILVRIFFISWMMRKLAFFVLLGGF